MFPAVLEGVRWCLIVVEIHISLMMGSPDSSIGKESALSAGDSGSILGWEDPCRRERLPNAVLWPGDFRGLQSPWGEKEPRTTKQLSLSLTLWRGASFHVFTGHL